MNSVKKRRSIRFYSNNLSIGDLFGGVGIIIMMIIAARMTELTQCFR